MVLLLFCVSVPFRPENITAELARQAAETVRQHIGGAITQAHVDAVYNLLTTPPDALHSKIKFKLTSENHSTLIVDSIGCLGLPSGTNSKLIFLST